MSHPAHRPPQDCPVCGDHLLISQLGCDRCGTALSGRFTTCAFCGLGEAQRELLRVFLVSRGNLKEVERHLGVSYPTARARYEELLTALGLSEPPEVDPRLATLRALASGEITPDQARANLD